MQTLQKPHLKSQKLISPPEKVEFVLDHLVGVRAYGNGFRAHCPAHDDQNPSLSIKTGYKGILLKCWSGCSLSEICRAIDLPESELFFDSPAEWSYKNLGTNHEKVNFNYRWNWRRQINGILAITEIRAALAEDFLEQVKSIDPATMTDDQRHYLLEQILLAWAWCEFGESVGDLCFAIARHEHRAEADR